MRGKEVRQMVKEDLKLAVTRMHKLDGDGATKAFCDISVMDSLIINGLRVVEGKDGLFVSMPREVGKDGKWYSTVIPSSREVKDKIEEVVLKAYGG
jgi:stage V sporulation protein G